MRTIGTELARSPHRATHPQGRVRFELAHPDDDAALRRLLRETPMPGQIDLGFWREPSYFHAAGIQGPSVQTIVARAGGEIAGVATRALRPTRVNGEATTVGFLSDLRLRPAYRGSTILARGYRFLRELHSDGRCEIYGTVIVEDNALALRTITSGRAGLPRYTPLGRILTPLVHVSRRGSAPPALPRGTCIERGSAATLSEIVARLNENHQQFAPVHYVNDFTSGRYPGLRPDDFLLLRREGRLAGVMALWDQRSFRQTVPHRYHGVLRWARPFLPWLGQPPLPATGVRLPTFFAAFVATDDDAALRTLMRAAHEHASRGDYSHFIVGLHEDDPRANCLREFAHTPFAGRLFAVTFDGPPLLDGRVPHVEAALL